MSEKNKRSENRVVDWKGRGTDNIVVEHERTTPTQTSVITRRYPRPVTQDILNCYSFSQLTSRQHELSRQERRYRRLPCDGWLS